MRARLADPKLRLERHQRDVERGVLDVLRSGRWVGGPWVARAETALAQRFELAHGVGAASGTDALILALQALGVGPGHRVAVPALSFFATTAAVLQVGAEPVFVDVLEDRPQWDPSGVDADFGVWVPLFGAWAPVPDGLALVADVAQAIGWGWGKPPGMIAALSLYPTKTVGAAGDAGAVLTDSPTLAARARALGNHGLTAPHVHDSLGRNSRLDPIQAAVLLPQLDTLDARVARRRAIADHYDRAQRAPVPRDPRDAVHHYIVRHPNRDALAGALDRAGADSTVYYPLPADVQLAAGGTGDARDTSCPRAAAWCRAMLAVPVHEDLTDDQVDRIARVLERA